MSNRAKVVAATCAAALLLGASCSKDDPKPIAGLDATVVEAECTTSDDCTAGDCIDLLCTWCLDTTCGAGTFCSQNGKCLACDGGCATPDVGTPEDAGTACTSRAQCGGYACRDGVCGPQDPSGACAVSDDCNAGFNCSGGSCQAGCTKNADCAGSPAGPRCDVATGRCGPCSEQADCDEATQNCVGGKCVAVVACPGGDRVPCGDLACVAELCRPCQDAAECGAGFECQDGKCQPRAGCSDDQQCKTLSEGHWCDQATSLCKWGCVAGAACGQNCCPLKQACNVATHQCEAAACNNCNGTCVAPKVCDNGSCACVDQAADAGVGGKCSALDCSCPNGLTCKCIGACAAPLCGLGTCG